MSAPSVTRPRRIRLRPWQSDALGKLAAADGRDFLAVATPGAGKTTFALAAVVQHLGDHPGRRVVVVAPTAHLKTQWSNAATVFGLHLDHLWSPAEGSLPDDMHGIVTTYQQVASASAAIAKVAEDAYVVLDEVHHAGEDRSWGAGLLEAFSSAAMRLSLSGTPFRSDDAEIPFVDYHLDEARPDVEYGYGEALSDGGVVRPVYFPRTGGFMEWVAPDGEQLSATFDDDLARERSNQRLRTALSLEGQWLPSVLGEADARLGELRRDHGDAAGLVIASDVEHARGIEALLSRHNPGDVVVVTSDDPDASKRIESFASSTMRWIVAVRMVSEGVDIPCLRLAVYATTTTTELFFRQAVGRVVRFTPGTTNQRAFVFLPDDPRLRLHASSIAEARRHSLKRRVERSAQSASELDQPGTGDDDEQLSMFSVIGSVATDSSEASPAVVFGQDPDGLGERSGAMSSVDATDAATIELLLHPPPLPSGRSRPSDTDVVSGGGRGQSLRERKAALRKANADVAVELVHATGWGHAQVNREMNRLAGIDRIGAATVAQLERRHAEGRRWLRSC